MTKSRDLGNLVSDGASSGVAVYNTSNFSVPTAPLEG